MFHHPDRKRNNRSRCRVPYPAGHTFEQRHTWRPLGQRSENNLRCARFLELLEISPLEWTLACSPLRKDLSSQCYFAPGLVARRSQVAAQLCREMCCIL